MLRKALALAFVIALGALPAGAQWGNGFAQGPTASGSAYVGPGDITPYKMFFSATRGYSAAAAAAQQNAVQLFRFIDSSNCTAKLATNGNVDYTVGTPCNGGTQTVTDWANGTNGVGTGSSAGTVLTITAMTSGSFAVGDVVYGSTSGSVYTGATYITSLGTGTGGIGTYNISNSQTRTSQTVYATPGIGVLTLYDQTIGNNCSGSSCDLSETGGTAMPLVQLTG